MLLLILALGGTAAAQLEFSPFPSAASGFSVTSLTDYQCLSSNPANLAITGTKKFHFGILESSFGFYSEPLSRSQVFNDFFASGSRFDAAQRVEAMDRFTDSRFLLNGSINWLGVSYQNEKAGGFAFSIRDRIFFNLLTNRAVSEILFQGYNADYFDQKIRDNFGNILEGIATQPKKLSELGQGAAADLSWYREFNFGYGHQLLKTSKNQVNIGIGLKYIQGFAFAQFYVDEATKLMTGDISALPILGNLLGDNSLSPVDDTGLVPVGSGVGFDIGFSGIVGSKFKWGLSIKDIGQVKWTGNVFKANDEPFVDMMSNGIDSYNIFTEASGIDAMTDYELVNTGPITRKLPMNMRAGVSYIISKVFEVGSEVYYPLIRNAAGDYNFPVISAGVSVKLRFMEVEAGANYSKYCGMNAPLALLFRPMNSEKFLWEIGIGSQDIVGLFQQNNYTLSAALAIVRFGF
jgi:hypothetical protein